MAMIKCPECGKDISDLASSCPNCGFPMASKSNSINLNNSIQYQIPPMQKTDAVKENKNAIKNTIAQPKIKPSKSDVKQTKKSIIEFICFVAMFFVIGAIFNLKNKESDKETINNSLVQQSSAEDQKIEDNNNANSEIEKKSADIIENNKDNEQNQVSEIEILFNDIPWGITFPEVTEKLKTWELWNISGEGYKEYSVDEILLGDYKGIDFEYSGINIISNAFNGEQEVAGYTTSEITLYFAYLPVEEYLSYDEKDTSLYGAQYKFEPINLQEMYNDLTEKLTDIYGEPSKITEDSDLWNNEYTYTYWYGMNNTELVLKSLNSENDTTNLYDDEIYISYAWREGDTLLKSASDAVKKEKADKEKKAQGSSNANGL